MRDVAAFAGNIAATIAAALWVGKWYASRFSDFASNRNAESRTMFPPKQRSHCHRMTVSTDRLANPRMPTMS
jgi:hypothetical protein